MENNNNIQNIQHFASARYKMNLWYDSTAGEAQAYLLDRGFSHGIINSFGLGYATASWDFITKQLLERGFPVSILEKSGMTITKVSDGGTARSFDRFRNRIIFPIYNVKGVPVGFGGRIFTETNAADNYQPTKYLNSPETEIYHKSEVLYGIFHAKEEIQKQDLCYVVEGYFDVIQMHGAGIKNTVASCGTALTVEQIRLIKQFTKHIVLIYDGDEAGIKASMKATDLILSEGCYVKIIRLNEKHDPDSSIRHMGGTDFKRFIEQHRLSFIQFHIQNRLGYEINKDVNKKVEVFKDLIISISKVADFQKRFHYLEDLCLGLGFKMELAISELNRILITKK